MYGCENVPIFVWGRAAAAFSYSTVLRAQSKTWLSSVGVTCDVQKEDDRPVDRGAKNKPEKGSGRLEQEEKNLSWEI